MLNFQSFLSAYCCGISAGNQSIRLVEIGSRDLNGSLRTVAPPEFEYIGVDFSPGRGVDIVLDSPYHLPFCNEFADVVVSSSCFEHSELFWVLFIEIMRITKPTGLFYLNAPSNGEFHRHPLDCWRFYPDSGRAMVTWAHYNGLSTCLLESYTSLQFQDQWNDLVAVFLKDESHVSRYPDRILDRKTDVINGLKFGSNEILKHSFMTEDQMRLRSVQPPGRN